MAGKIERLASFVMAAAAVAVAVVVIHREFYSSSSPSVNTGALPVYVDGWARAVEAGLSIGNENAPVKVVEFVDFECPYCARYHAVMHSVMAAHANDVLVTLVHFPIPGHRFARPAAQAVECAQRQGRLLQMVDLLYHQQDSLGLKTWTRYAADAAVPDTAAFGACAAATATFGRIDEGVRIGKLMGVRGTPTILVNGWRFPLPPDEDELKARIKAMLAKKTGNSKAN